MNFGSDLQNDASLGIRQPELQRPVLKLGSEDDLV